MSESQPKQIHEAIAPEPVRDLNWSPARAREFSERLLALWQELLAELPTLPVARREGETEVREAVALPVPDEPLGDDALVAHLREIFSHSTYIGHPRFLAYISGAGTVPGAAADLLAAGLNPNLRGWLLAPAATEIELHLGRWFAQQFGLPERAGGLMVTGGAMANFVGLKTARDAQHDWMTRRTGLAGLPPLSLYCSEQAHAVIERAADMLGLGSQAVRKIPVDDAWRMRPEALRERIEADIAAGAKPVAIVGTAGTTATGAIDPLNAIADLCQEYGLWFHVDAAYGGPAVLTDDLRPLFAGIERADSIAFDPHKWLYTPRAGGCLLIRDLQLLADAFAVHPTYIYQDRESTERGIDLGLLGPEFTRSFSAFKVWVSLLAHGQAAYVRRISHDAALARYMGERVMQRPDFELMAPVSLSICCFRYVPEGLPDTSGREEYLDRLNERLMTAIQLDGRAFCSNAVLHGRFVLRICIVNYRTEASDLDALLAIAAELGARLDSELR
ncbi:MAG TPA: aminotransferase class V-fold PLP-dependent enzyme [Ktedonobacterales bacterium]|nr:aminotransferase class V-fold PLP-dependent enzyme [Ktedonobacterales bacterium]